MLFTREEAQHSPLFCLYINRGSGLFVLDPRSVEYSVAYILSTEYTSYSVYYSVLDYVLGSDHPTVWVGGLSMDRSAYPLLRGPYVPGHCGEESRSGLGRTT